jgi:hypothetical protein
MELKMNKALTVTLDGLQCDSVCMQVNFNDYDAAKAAQAAAEGYYGDMLNGFVFRHESESDPVDALYISRSSKMFMIDFDDEAVAKLNLPWTEKEDWPPGASIIYAAHTVLCRCLADFDQPVFIFLRGTEDAMNFTQALVDWKVITEKQRHF